MGEGGGIGGSAGDGSPLGGFGSGHSQGDAALLGMGEASITPAGTAFGNQFSDVGALSSGDAKSMGLGPSSKLGGIIGGVLGAGVSAFTGMPGAMQAGREIGSRVGGGGFTGTSGPLSAGNAGRSSGAGGADSGTGPGPSGGGSGAPAQGQVPPTQGVGVDPQHTIKLAQAITERDPVDVGLSLSSMSLPMAEQALADLQQRLRVTQQALRLNKTRQKGMA